MSFHSYLDQPEEKAGLTPLQIVDRLSGRGYDVGTKPGEIVAWFAADLGLGLRLHGVATGRTRR